MTAMTLQEPLVKQYITRELFITVLAIFMGSLQLGINLGLPSNTQDVIQAFMNKTLTEREGVAPSEDRITNLWAITVANLFLGAAVGASGNRWLSNRTSRRGCIMFDIGLGFVASAFLFSSRRSGLWEILLVGRFLSGTLVGLYASQVPIYLSEISPKMIRGAVISLNPLGLVTAFMIGQILGFPNILGSPDLWDCLYGVTVVPVVFQLLLLPFCVESPRYLMISKGDEEAAKQALMTLRQSDNVEEEMAEMREELRKDTQKVTLIQLFRHPSYRRPMLLVTVGHLSLQLCGLNGVVFYSNSLFQEAGGLSQQEAAYVTAAMGAVSTMAVAVVTPLSDVLGRRKLLLGGLASLIFITGTTALFLALGETVQIFNIFAIVMLVSFLIFFNIGPGLVPWIIVGEYFAQNTKPAASAFALACHFISGFIVAYIFPPLLNILMAYVFIPFCVINTIIFIYFYLQLPETKGKTFEEICAIFEGRDKTFSAKDQTHPEEGSRSKDNGTTL